MSDTTVRNIHQLISEDGKAYAAVGTENVWIGYGSGQQFGHPTGNNDVTPLTSGKIYFDEFIKATESAKEEIYIVGWQVNWDALLAPKTRLFDVLLAAAKRNVKIYVMPWNDSPPVQTYDDQTKIVLEMINAITGKNSVEVQLADAHADKDAAFFSHHQKQIVIDRETAFIGGMDLAYGRYDDAHYDLHANAEDRYALNRYNGCLLPTGKIDAGMLVDPDTGSGLWDKNARIPFYKKSKTNDQLALEKVKQGAWQSPYETQGGGTQATGLTTSHGEIDTVSVNMLDAARQPRMPWQDVHCKIMGPAALELARNFVMRWNSTKPITKLTMPAHKTVPIEKKCLVQVLRSAPLAMRTLEYNALSFADKKNCLPPNVAQDDILQAMLTIIDKAQHFIYIENQFFVSAFGALAGYPNASPDSDPRTGPAKHIMDEGGGIGRGATRAYPGDPTDLPSNGILDAIAKKIDFVIRNAKPQPFHVYITLPVHPEGLLSDGPVMAQVHWTMQSLVFGSQSLLNRIRRSLQARATHNLNPKANWDDAFLESNKDYLNIPIEDCFDFVTLLNLRNWAKLGKGENETYVTEQIYVHSKLLIVDDRYAILGSANINDRSLLGGRDSELAVLVVDTDNKTRDLKQNGKQVPVRHFARDLRKQVWRKIFSITAGGNRAANELKNAVLHPAAPASWKAIQKRARQNTDLYEAAFDWIPQNMDPTDDEGKRFSTIWPRWDVSIEVKRNVAKKNDLPYKHINPMPTPMPFDAAFWNTPQHHPEAAKNLSEVKGFITLLPIHWTKGENNKIPYHNALITQFEKPKFQSDTEAKTELATNRVMHTTEEQT